MKVQRADREPDRGEQELGAFQIGLGAAPAVNYPPIGIAVFAAPQFAARQDGDVINAGPNLAADDAVGMVDVAPGAGINARVPLAVVGEILDAGFAKIRVRVRAARGPQLAQAGINSYVRALVVNDEKAFAVHEGARIVLENPIVGHGLVMPVHDVARSPSLRSRRGR